MKIFVAYEDQGAARTFGPHRLAIACLSDRLGLDSFRIDAWFDPVPKKGNARLLEFCQDVPRLAGQRPFFALFDDDRLSRVLREKKLIDQDLPRAEMLQTIAALDRRLRVHCIDRNVETLVDRGADILGEPRPNKGINDRDLVLGRLAKPGARLSRDELCKRVPTFAAFVDDLAQAAAVRGMS